MALKQVTLLQAAPLTQPELEYLIGIRNQIRKLCELYDMEAERLIDRLLAGAPVEPGNHSAALRQHYRNGARIVRLCLDSDAEILLISPSFFS